MYLKTPKRYQKGGMRRGVSRHTLVLLILAGIGILLADFVLKNQATLQQGLDDMVASVSTLMATRSVPPTATPAVDPMLCLSRANAAYEVGNLVTAIEQYRCAAAGLPNDLRLHTQLAFMLTVSGKPQEGLEAARRAILADPTAPDGYAITGMALDWVASATRQDGLYNEALAYVLRALDIDANYADAYAFMAEIYTDLGRIEDAYRAAQKALEIDPENFKAYRNYGYALQVQGYYEDAAAAFEQAVRINPKMPYVRIQLAQMYFSMNRVDDAMDLLLQAVQLTGGDPESYYWLGHGYARYQGDYAAARRTWETCVDIDPKYIGCWERLGGVLLFQQDYDLAANAYARAIELGSAKPDVFYYAAYVNQLTGHCERAVNVAQRGLQLENVPIQTQTDLHSVIDQCRGASTAPDSQSGSE